MFFNLFKYYLVFIPKQGSQNRWEPVRFDRFRWNRSGPVHESVWFPPQNRAYKFASTVNRPVSLVNRPGFCLHGNRWYGGLVNPGPKTFFSALKKYLYKSYFWGFEVPISVLYWTNQDNTIFQVD
jgi:hypothetical protein